MHNASPHFWRSPWTGLMFGVLGVVWGLLMLGEGVWCDDGPALGGGALTGMLRSLGGGSLLLGGSVTILVAVRRMRRRRAALGRHWWN